MVGRRCPKCGGRLRYLAGLWYCGKCDKCFDVSQTKLSARARAECVRP